jgi:hypothetical protein
MPISRFWRSVSAAIAHLAVSSMNLMRAGWIIALAFCGLGSPTFGEDFYQQFISLVDTNRFTQPLWAFPTLIDTNNTGIKVTNTVLDLGNLKQRGEISGVSLGMTMQGVVDSWGKPQGGWSRCLHGLITFFYSGVSLGFEGNRLETICLFPSGKFAGGLSSGSQAKEFVQVLGPPTERRMSGNNCSLVYLSPGGNLRLDFHEEELVDIYLERTSSRAQPWNQIIRANPQGGANRSQPVHPDTNQMSATAGSGRSP